MILYYSFSPWSLVIIIRHIKLLVSRKRRRSGGSSERKGGGRGEGKARRRGREREEEGGIDEEDSPWKRMKQYRLLPPPFFSFSSFSSSFCSFSSFYFSWCFSSFLSNKSYYSSFLLMFFFFPSCSSPHPRHCSSSFSFSCASGRRNTRVAPPPDAILSDITCMEFSEEQRVKAKQE